MMGGMEMPTTVSTTVTRTTTFTWAISGWERCILFPVEEEEGRGGGDYRGVDNWVGGGEKILGISLVGAALENFLSKKSFQTVFFVSAML